MRLREETPDWERLNPSPAVDSKGMVMSDEALDTYDAEHIRERLITDPRVSELDVQVQLAGAALVLTGNVATGDRRQTVAEVVAELAPGVEVRNDISVTSFDEPTDQEVVS